MEIIRAEYMGFCGGVDRAIRITNEALEAEYDKLLGVWSVGAIIHNENVMAELKEKGLRVAGSLDEIPNGATVIVRSHGESPEFFDLAEEKCLRIIDATCPKVASIHELARDADARGEHVVVVGDMSHPEVQAVKAWGGGDRATVIEDVGAAWRQVIKSDELGETLFVVSQTTFEKDAFEEIADCFREANTGFCYGKHAGSMDGVLCGDMTGKEWIHAPAKVNNTICEATALRQEACRKLAENVDFMIVIGDKHSSNTKKLYEIAKKTVKKSAIFIENSNEISLKHLYGCDKLGLTAGASTPNHIVEEVISSMSEFRSENYETNPMHEFMDEIDRSTRLPRNGDIVTGEVIQVTDSEVTVNLGCKKDGVIPKSEVSLEEGQTLQDAYKEGDEVQAKVMKNDDGEGNILLSKKRVVVSEHWETITQAYEDKTPIEVKVAREVSGGVIAMFSEVGGFIPFSQLSDRYIEKADEFIGQTLPVKVIRLDQKRNKVVFSHKAVLNEERQKRMQEIWDQLSVGDIISGRVMRFTDYGAFVDIGGVDGLLHISEISWGKMRHPSDLLELDQKIDVKILSMNKEKEKISLGYKQNRPEPWSIINEKYHVGQVIHGKAVQIKDYGVFVEIEPGLDGLVHISEIAFRRVTDISEELELGQEVSAKILEIDSVRKRISLSIKETLDKPSDDDTSSSKAHAPAPAKAEEPQAAAEEAAVEDIVAAEILIDDAEDKAIAAVELQAEADEEASVAEALMEDAAEKAAAAEELLEEADEEAAAAEALALEAVEEAAVADDAADEDESDDDEADEADDEDDEDE